jgi:hypothetical protein
MNGYALRALVAVPLLGLAGYLWWFREYWMTNPSEWPLGIAIGTYVGLRSSVWSALGTSVFGVRIGILIGIIVIAIYFALFGWLLYSGVMPDQR